MPDAPVAAPSAPAPAPAGPATEATAPTPTSPNAGSGAWDALDALGGDDATPAAPVKPVSATRPKDPKTGLFVKATEKPVEPAKPEAAKDIDPSKMKAGELAKHYHALKKEREEWVKKEADYQKKLSTPPEWPEKKSWEEKVTQHQKELEAERKRVADYENELRFSAYERSQECKDKYDKPINDAWLEGREIASSFRTVERKDDADVVIEKSRKGTAEDFDELMQINDHDAAAEKAIALFGPVKAAEILAARRAVFQRSVAKSNAIKDYREKGTEREKVFRDQQEKWQKDATSMVEREMQAAVEKYPAFFKPDEADPKGNDLLNKGKYALERVLKGGAPITDGDKQWTNEEYARAVARIRNGAIAFPRVAYRLNQALKENKDLKAKLAEFETSVPGNGDGHGRTVVIDDDDPFKKLDAMATESRG